MRGTAKLWGQCASIAVHGLWQVPQYPFPRSPVGGQNLPLLKLVAQHYPLKNLAQSLSSTRWEGRSIGQQ